MNKWFISLVVIILVISIGGFFWLKRDEVPLYLAVETPPAPALTPGEALESFVLAPGFDIEMVAAEPLVVDPVAMAWDEAGRLFVVEMRGFMPDAFGTGEDRPVGRVVMLVDENGDGKMDRSEIFLDGLVLPRAVAVVNEGLLVGEPPTLWLCPDIQGKTRCENRRKVGDYATEHEHISLEHLENGLMSGLDNWLYNANSDRRFRFVNGKLQVETTLPRGQWGIAQDNQGRLYYNHNSTFLIGDYFLAHSSGGISGGLAELITENDEVFSIRVNTGVNRAYVDGVLRNDGRLKSPTAVSGLAVYRGGQFPTDYWSDIFVPEPAANVLVQLRAALDDFEVTAEHITYPDKHWERREFLASKDERFRPVDLKVGPDGALYIIDMYRGIIQHKDFLSEELRAQILERGLDKPLGQGRIWRIVHSDSKRLPAPDLSEASTAELLVHLSSNTPWVRETAQRLLVTRPNAMPGLKSLVISGSKLAAIHALWALEAQGQLDESTLLSALERNQPAIARQALRAGNEMISKAQLLAINERLLEDTATALAWLDSLQRFNNDEAVKQKIVGELLTKGGNLYRREGAVRASRGVEIALIDRLLKPNALTQDEESKEILKEITFSAYLTEAKAPARARESLEQLLERIYDLVDDRQWQQLAMLAGLSRAAQHIEDPVQLASAPSLFTDISLAGDDPLWAARLSARKAFTWPGDEMALGKVPLTGEQTALLDKGRKLYRHCASCHGDSGQGVAGLAPGLVGSDWVTGPVEWLARIVLDGMRGGLTVNGTVGSSVMPAHRHLQELDAETLTGLLIFLRRLGSNRADAPSVQTVRDIMAEPPRSTLWTAEEIRQVPYASTLDKFAGKYKISFVTLTVTVEEDKLMVRVPMQGSSVLQQLDDTRFVPEQEGEGMAFRFELGNSGEVEALFLNHGGQEHRAEKVR